MPACRPGRFVQGAKSKLNVLLAHPGTQYAFRLAVELHRRDALLAFHTGLAFSAGGWRDRFWKAMPGPWRRPLASRRIAGLPPQKLRVRPFGELVALLQLRRGRDSQQVIHRRNELFQRAIPDAIIKRANAVIGFDTSSWILARRTRGHGRLFFLDQSIGHSRSFARVGARLSKDFPDWTAQIPRKSQEEFMCEEQEHADASFIIVPSRFVARTLEENGVDAKKIRINPFGVDLECFQPRSIPPPLKPLRFVFAGSLQPRKGLPLLLAAWKALPDNHGAELWVAGGGEIPASVRGGVSDSVRFLGRLPQAELSQVFQKCHLLVFPSYFEGLAQVQIEAAACGLPVIGTVSSGCEEIVRNGETGFVLPAGDLDGLRAALLKFISTPELALAMRGRLLAERARWSWDAYGDRWMRIFEESLKAENGNDLRRS